MNHHLRGRLLAPLSVAAAATAALTALVPAGAASAAAKDTTKPKASFTAPAVNAIVGSKVTTTISASDNKKVTKAQLYVAGKLAGTRTAAPWSLTPSLAGKNGTVKLEWRVYDAAGNKTVVTRTVVADNTKPKASFSAPAVNALVGSKTATTVAVSDNTKVVKAQLYVAGTLVGTRTAAPWSLTPNLAGKNGSVPLEWRVYDAAGNSAAVTRTVIVDSTAPTVSITGGLDSDGYLSGPQTITVDASDDRALKYVEIIVNGQVVARDTTAPYTATIDASKYGKIIYSARATDTAGNIRTTADGTANGELLAPPPVDAPAFSAPTAGEPTLVSCTTNGEWRTVKYEITLTGGAYSMGSAPRKDYGWNNGSATYTQTATTAWKVGSSYQPKVLLLPVMVADPGSTSPEHSVYGGVQFAIDSTTCQPLADF